MEVAILGCGYVGLAVGRRLREGGHRVIGVRRSSDGLDTLRRAGLEAMQADVTEPASLEGIPSVDALVFAASTGGGGASAARRVYVEGLENVISVFGGRPEPPGRLLYTSSTGVYGDHGRRWVDEET
jgi:nucleoside-diphosphate-sugar epimerase